jgi:WD40 repeat protein
MAHAQFPATRSRSTLTLITVGTVGALLTVGACGPNTQSHDSDGAVDTPDAPPTPTSDASEQPDATPSGPPYADFPVDPVIEPGAPGNAGDLFGVPDAQGAGPCVSEPEPNTLYPLNWLRARVRYQGQPGQNLFEIRFHTEDQINDLVVYTASSTWTIPKPLWTALNQHMVGSTVTVTVRGAQYTGSGLNGAPTAGNPTSFTIAPVSATGAIVYWTAAENGSGVAFKGFQIGDEGVTTVMQPTQAGVACVGCHNSTPDGKYVGFSANLTQQDARPAYSDIRSVDGDATLPPFMTQQARNLLSRAHQQQPFFSGAHWEDGDHRALTMFEVNGKTEIIWTDLETTSEAQGTGWGIVAREGHTGSAAAGAWSHDGQTIAYGGAAIVTSGMNLDSGGGNIYTVPYNGGAGGPATVVTGADNASYSEHYPAFSADDQMIAFTRVQPTTGSYDNPVSEVYIVPTAGGTAVRLAANDPPTCGGFSSPGVGNSWPKWSPKVEDSNGKTYYWLTFSSKRTTSYKPQLYVAAITVENGVVTTYPALYLWNQPENESNHTPAWDDFEIVVD